MPNTDRLKLELQRSAQPFAMLVFLLICGGITFGIIFKNLTFERPWQDYREVRAEFDDVKGIFPGGHQVRINGVKVGVVKASNVVDGRAVLTLSIEEKWGMVYKNAKMRIRPVTPLQDLYVNITDRGTPEAGEATVADVIGADQTETPVDVSRVLNTFSADTRERMTVLLSELDKALGDQGGERLKASFNEIAPFLKTAERASRELATRDNQVKRIVNNFGELSEALAKRDGDLNRFVRRGNVALGELAVNDAPLDATFSSLADLLPVMQASFRSVRGLTGELDPALRSLKPVTEELESGLKGLQSFGKDALPAFEALRPAVGELRTMSRVLEPTAKSLDTAFGRLAPQAKELEEITKYLVPCFEQKVIQDFFANTVSVLKYGDANGAFPRAETTADADLLGTSPGINTRPTPFCTDDVKGD